MALLEVDLVDHHLNHQVFHQEAEPIVHFNKLMQTVMDASISMNSVTFLVCSSAHVCTPMIVNNN